MYKWNFTNTKYTKQFRRLISTLSHLYFSTQYYSFSGYHKLQLEEREWEGISNKPLNIWDSGGRFTKGMYVEIMHFKYFLFKLKKDYQSVGVV